MHRCPSHVRQRLIQGAIRLVRSSVETYIRTGAPPRFPRPIHMIRMRFSPASLVAELRRRHVFRVAGIYAVVGWLVIQIAATVFPHLHLPGWTISFVIVLTVLGFPIALVLAWALEITPEGIQRTSAGTAAGDDSVVGTGASPQAIAADAKESAKTETKPLPSATAPPRTSLPAPPTPLIGREKEARELQEHLLRAEVRLLTLIGPGGTGKTRLAMHVASEQMERFADGTFFIDLAPITDPALVPSAIARVLGVTEEPERPLTETYRSTCGRSSSCSCWTTLSRSPKLPHSLPCSSPQHPC